MLTMWRRHVTVSITTMSAFFAPAHAARVPIALLSTITSTISTNVAPRHVSCVAPEHVDTRVGAVDIRLPWPRNLLTTTVWAEAASPSNNHQKYFYHLLSWILVYSWPGCLNISYYRIRMVSRYNENLALISESSSIEVFWGKCSGYL